jgi:hypothetical protein
MARRYPIGSGEPGEFAWHRRGFSLILLFFPQSRAVFQSPGVERRRRPDGGVPGDRAGGGEVVDWVRLPIALRLSLSLCSERHREYLRPPCRLAALPPCRLAALPPCRLAALPPGRPAALPPCRPVIDSTLHPNYNLRAVPVVVVGPFGDVGISPHFFSASYVSRRPPRSDSPAGGRPRI